LTQRNRVVGLAARHMLPTIYPYGEYFLAGGLMSYGTRWLDEFYKVGISNGRIQQVTKIELAINQVTKIELAINQVTKIELAINLKLAKTLNRTIPEPLFGRADGVIE
jgi:putative ABC transport system substrate-binding protein